MIPAIAAVIVTAVLLVRAGDPDLEAIIWSYRQMVRYGYSESDLSAGALRGMLQSITDDYAHLEMPAGSVALPTAMINLKRYPGVFYVRVTGFSSKTGAEFENVIRELEPKDCLIIDVRGCPGGDVGSSIRIAQCICPAGKPFIRIVTLEKEERTYAGSGLCQVGRVYVFIDGLTASSAELLTASLKYGAGAVILGSPSFGKDSVQSKFLLPNGTIIDVTSGYFTYPDGTRVGPIKPETQVDWTMNSDRLEDFVKALANPWPVSVTP